MCLRKRQQVGCTLNADVAVPLYPSCLAEGMPEWAAEATGCTGGS